MLFNSLDFAIFLPVVFLLYWFVANQNLKLQNLLIVVSSLVFYGWWDWRFLSLIVFSTLLDFTVGWKLASNDKNESRRRLLLWTSIISNLGILGFFKYFNFFQENFVAAFSFFGAKIPGNSLNIILPVGISFYTFQTLSYTIDVYKRKLEPTRDLVSFAAFVCFFPQLVAGPIERASNLLPQFFSQRNFNYGKAVDGLRQILWGLFKKVVVADNCAGFVNQIFDHSAELNGSTLLLGACFFAFQIYGDFSGYSDIAIGTARLLGFELKQNFAFPYFSRDVAEFWRRWHISLSTWFRDYLYVPLGGSRCNTMMKIRNTFIIFIVSGFWHGANWTFIAWGALNALYFLPLLLAGKNRNHLEIVACNQKLPNLNELLMMLMTFGLMVFAWIFFRANNISHAISYVAGIATPSLFSTPELITSPKGLLTLVFILICVVVEWSGRRGEHALALLLLKRSKILRWLFYFVLALTILLFSGSKQEFIYFQF